MELKTRKPGKHDIDSHEQSSTDEPSLSSYSGPGITNPRKSLRPNKMLKGVDRRRVDQNRISKSTFDQMKRAVTESIRRGDIALEEEDSGEETLSLPTALDELLEAVRKELRNAPHHQSAPESKVMKHDPLQAARQRGTQTKGKLLEAEGGTYSAIEVSALLDLARQTVDDRRKAGTLIGLKGEKRGYRYPKWQFSDDGLVLDGLPEILTTLNTLGSWAKAAFMLNRNKRLNDQRPLDLLRRGEWETVLAAAQRYGDHDGL